MLALKVLLVVEAEHLDFLFELLLHALLLFQQRVFKFSGHKAFLFQLVAKFSLLTPSVGQFLRKHNFLLLVDFLKF